LNVWNFAREQPLLDIGVLQFLRCVLILSCAKPECTLRVFEPDCVATGNMSPADRKNSIDTADTIFDYP